MNDNQELNSILENPPMRAMGGNRKSSRRHDDLIEDSDRENKALSNLVQWTTGDDRRFLPASKTTKKLLAGVYEIRHCPSAGVYFERFPVKTEGLIRFPQTNSDKVVQEIQNFWEREHLFKDYGLTYKRGIILWGPPGSGKSCTVQIIMKDVVERGGIVIKFVNPGLFIEGMRVFRDIEKDTPAVVLMEDIDSTLEIYNESEVLNILDGVEEVEKVVFLATTNYPDRLGARIINRPSRFDKRFKIGHPNKQSREIYFKHLVGEEKIRELDIDIDRWVRDTEGLSIAHLKELFVAVVILGDDYEEAIETLNSMKEDINPSHYEDRNPMGFGRHCYDDEEDCCEGSCG